MRSLFLFFSNQALTTVLSSDHSVGIIVRRTIMIILNVLRLFVMVFFLVCLSVLFQTLECYYFRCVESKDKATSLAIATAIMQIVGAYRYVNSQSVHSAFFAVHEIRININQLCTSSRRE